MKEYEVEHLVLTLTRNAVMDNKDNPGSFVEEGIEFSHQGFTFGEGWQTDHWICSSKIEADSFVEAVNSMRKNLNRLVPRISLISQSYIDFVQQPFVVISGDIAFFRYTRSRKGVGLMFSEKERDALKLLLVDDKIPEEFYFYWNDAVNAVGYSAKLLLMFSALESLFKDESGRNDYERMEQSIGKELVCELFGTKENPSQGLRHRLVHGEYLRAEDSKTDYVEVLHRSVIKYFNAEVLGADLISEEVVSPQRHFFGNREGGNFFVKSKDGKSLNLSGILRDFEENGVSGLTEHTVVVDKEVSANF